MLSIMFNFLDVYINIEKYSYLSNKKIKKK